MPQLWYGGTIYTMQEEGKTVEAVVTDYGHIAATGSKAELERLYETEQLTKYSLEGAIMYPGFVDSHLHMIGHGERLLKLDLSAVHSAEKMKDLIRQYAASKKPKTWVVGEGWNENQLPDRKIFHRLELDELAPNHPLVLTRICRHAMLVNSEALQMAGIDETTENPEGGVIVKDDDGKPTGLLLDTAQELVRRVLPDVTEEMLQEALETSVKDLLKRGLVGGHTEDLNYYGSFHKTFKTFLSLLNDEQLAFRAQLLVHHEVMHDMVDAGFQKGDGNAYVTLGPVKIFSDGALGGRTALLRTPYCDAPDTKGIAVHTIDDLKGLVKGARAFGLPVAIHAIGDLALEYVVEALEASPPPSGERDRIIHCQVTPPDLIRRMQKLPIVCDIQPQFVSSDFPWVIERLGEERMPYSFAWKTLLDHNLHCAGGSDAPIEIPDPLLGIYAAVTRKKREEKRHEGYYASEKLSVYEAISLYTTGSAYAEGQETHRGQITKGYVADFTILDQDLAAIDPEKIPDVHVQMTVVGGKVMYKRIQD